MYGPDFFSNGIELITSIDGEAAVEGRYTSRPETAAQLAPSVYTSPGLDLSPDCADVRVLIRKWRNVFRIPNQTRKTNFLICA